MISEKALLHLQDDLSHKILSVKEHHGSKAADYPIRSSLSEGKLSMLVTLRNEVSGDLEAVEKHVPAEGLVFVETTTQDRVHLENQTRLFDLYIDESPEQTKRILKSKAKSTTKDNDSLEPEFRLWRAAQTLLEPVDILIPYAEVLVEAFPVDKIRVRRDFPRFLSLIKSHTLLHQFQRAKDSKGSVKATLDDLEAVIPLAAVVLEQSLKELSPNQEKVLEIIRTNFSDAEFSLRELSKLIDGKVHNRTLQHYLSEDFSKNGLIEWNGQKGKGSKYNLCLSVSSLRNTSILASNLSKILDILRRQPPLSSNVANVVDSPIGDNNDNKRQMDMSSIKVNDVEGLGAETSNDDMTTPDNKHLKDNRPPESKEGSLPPEDTPPPRPKPGFGGSEKTEIEDEMPEDTKP